MKRLIAAGVLLIVVTVSYLFSFKYIDNSNDEVKAVLTECEAAYEKDKPAEKAAEKLQDLWDEKEKWLSFFVNHNRIDEIELEIVSIKVYCKSDEKTMFEEHVENLKMLLHQLREDTEISTHSIF